MSSSSFIEFDSIFSIPDITETPPTLEEILNHDDDNDDDLKLDEVVEYQEQEKLDDIEYSSLLSDFLEESDHIPHLILTPLNNIKSQILLSQDEKINSGNPTSLFVSKNYTAIGTFHGYILVFDCTEKLKLFLKNNPEFGSIAALSINNDESKLICGSSKGTISLWNLNNGEMLRLIDDLHAPFSSIINLKYLSDPNFIILSDSSGSVFILDGRKKDFDSKCIFTGSRGEVLALEPLIIDNIANYPAYSGIEEFCIVAMATVSKVLVITARPNLVLHFTDSLRANPEFLPFLSWSFSFTDKNEHVPLFLFGRQDQMFITKIVTDFVEKIDFVHLYQFNATNYLFQYVCWFQADTIIVVDTNETIHLVDITTQKEIESKDISHIELIYGSSHYKSLVNGGYVSQAMAKAGDHACCNSFSLRKDGDKQKLYILGLKCSVELSIRTFEERVDFLNEKGKFVKALELLYDQYIFTKEKVPENSALLDEILSKMQYSLCHFEDNVLASGIEKSKNEHSIRGFVTLMLKYAILLPTNYEKILELFEEFSSNAVSKCIFLECLEPYILDNQLSHLNPLLVKEFVDLYIDKRWYNLLDSVITHFDISCLDIDYIIKLSLDYLLYDSYIYIHNFAFQDFISPFDRLLSILEASINDKLQFSDEDILLGNKLLVYLSCMLTCVYYPNKGPLLTKEKEHLEQVYARIVAINPNDKPNILSVLLRYDCNEFLNVILIAFRYLDRSHPELLKWKQILIDLLISHITDDDAYQYSIDQRMSFFIFLARCFINNNYRDISKANFDLVVEYLFLPENKRFDERQEILIQILEDTKFKSLIDMSLFLDKAEKNKMYKICEYIHQLNQNWVLLFYVYLEDGSKSEKIFDYINSLFSQDYLLKMQDERDKFLNVVFDNVLILAKFDCKSVVDLLFANVDQCENLFQLIMEKLILEPSVLYQFLKLTILENRVNYSKTSSNSSKSHSKIFDICFNAQYQEKFVELTCQFEPSNIIFTLQNLQEYNQFNALKICNQFKVTNGEAYLYEKMKNFDKSFSILFKDFKNNVRELIKTTVFNLTQDQGHICCFKVLIDKFEHFLNFCNRSSKFFADSKTNEKYWISTLEFLIEVKIDLNNIHKLTDELYLAPYLKLFSCNKLKSALDEFVSNFDRQFKLLFEKLIHSMLTHLNLVVFLDIIVSKVLQQNEDIYDIREILLCILDNYNYEKTLLGLTNNILSTEHHQLVNQFKSINTKSKNIRYLYCCFCFRSTLSRLFNNEKDLNYVIYSCNHLFHKRCLDTIKIVKKDINDIESCPSCNHLIDDELFKMESVTEFLLEDEMSSQDDEIAKQNKHKVSHSLLINDIQFRALNYFHNGKLKR